VPTFLLDFSPLRRRYKKEAASWRRPLEDDEIVELVCHLLERERTVIAGCLTLVDVTRLLARNSGRLSPTHRITRAEYLRDCADAIEHKHTDVPALKYRCRHIGLPS
jgi:hypothetical protein